MTSKTRKNTQEAATEHGEGQNTLEAQLAGLRAELATRRTNRQVQPARPTEPRPRVPSGLPKFKGKLGEDVRQWHFQVKTLCRIHGHDGDNDNTTLPSIAGTAMEDPASGWFLFWASRTLAEEQTWAQFTRDALAHCETSNYQAVLRQKLRQIRQVDDIEDYNGKCSALIFRVENMNEVDQVSYYCDGLKRATPSLRQVTEHDGAE
ncbi:unnamed protein product [Phytophthora fragariaefolia]|uniref:Unnamed protein product n=1 Tax=Phytophthora fragariaefolia TaxID=1490495 RepID=A0A9W6XSQ5_9STRA|nr:unnamed protein product [Phytophthora fragariaefolia]